MEKEKSKLADLPSIDEIIEKVVAEMCDKYCRFPHQEWEHDEAMYEAVCNDCPLNKLGV